MAEYIKRDVVMRGIMAAKWMDGYDGAMAMEIAASAPAADVSPVVHAYWIEGHDYIKCSVCRGMAKRDFRDGCWNYCPNCGAKMDGGNS